MWLLFTCQDQIRKIEVSVKKMVAIYSKHIYREKKICVFTNYRTGSSSLTQNIATLNNIESVGEQFAYESVDRDISKFEKTFLDIHKNNQFVLKLMADHLRYNDELINKVLSSVDKIIYLYRRDFTAQAKSYIASYLTHTLGPFGYKEIINSKSSIINVPENYTEHFDNIVNKLKMNYLKMSEFYKKVPGDLLCLEDFEVKRPYIKTVIWPGPEPIIEPYDVESLFVKQHEMG